MDQLETNIDGFAKLLQQLYGLPADVLVVASCIVLGYGLKACKVFPNSGIPLAVILWGAVFFPILADASSTLPFRVWICRNVLFGLLLGFISWLLHNKVLARIEAKLGLFNGDSPPPGPTGNGQ